MFGYSDNMGGWGAPMIAGMIAFWGLIITGGVPFFRRSRAAPPGPLTSGRRGASPSRSWPSGSPIRVSLAGAQEKISDPNQRAHRTAVNLGLPTYTDTTGRITGGNTE